jgi:diguanylate cyclase
MEEPSRQRWASWGAAAALGLGVLLLWIEAGLGGQTATLAATDVGNLVAAGAAALACGFRARREEGRAKLGWLALGAACACWAFGVGYVSYVDLWVQRGVPFADRAIPFPSVADIGFLSFVPLALAGVAWIPRGVFRAQLRTQYAVDGAIVALTVLAVAWTFLLGEVVATGQGSHVQMVLALIYPVMDVLLAATALCAWTFVPAEERGNLLLVILGLLLLALADFGFIMLVERGVVGISAINVLWPAGFAALALGAGRPRDAETALAEPRPVGRHLVRAAGLTGAVLIGFQIAGDSMDRVLQGVAGLLALAWILRVSLRGMERRRTLRRRQLGS